MKTNAIRYFVFALIMVLSQYVPHRLSLCVITIWQLKSSLSLGYSGYIATFSGPHIIYDQAS